MLEFIIILSLLGMKFPNNEGIEIVQVEESKLILFCKIIRGGECPTEL